MCRHRWHINRLSVPYAVFEFNCSLIYVELEFNFPYLLTSPDDDTLRTNPRSSISRPWPDTQISYLFHMRCSKWNHQPVSPFHCHLIGCALNHVHVSLPIHHCYCLADLKWCVLTTVVILSSSTNWIFYFFMLFWLHLANPPFFLASQPDPHQALPTAMLLILGTQPQCPPLIALTSILFTM